MNKRTVYLDNNATTPLHPRVKERIKQNLDTYGNASSFHFLGRTARREVETARREVAAFINAVPEEITFVGSGSEANNTVLNIFSSCCNVFQGCDLKKTEILVSTIEHPCILEAANCLQKKGVSVKYINVDKTGRLDLNNLEQKLSPQTGLVSVMMANNEIGTIQDIKAIAAIAHRQGARMHTDAVQALGKIPVDVDELGVDFLSLSAHKVYGPKGVGVLYTRKGTPFCPFIRGGHQEQGKRAGTENTLGIIGLGEAVMALKDDMESDCRKYHSLRAKLKQGITEKIPDIQFNGHQEYSLPGTLNVSFRGAEGESILLYLDLEGIAASTGSACASGSLDPSHVLLAAGIGVEYAHGSIRFSIGRENTEADIDYVLEKLPPVITRIRDMSTAY
ncbi:MAG TPA: aminotransferase class V-fold PLP-dependent enzyme [Spirochaetota bacterium]|nr:aminotransferase class V-fold PLP-dependent enzyme [Spirochaetota bacterium]